MRKIDDPSVPPNSYEHAPVHCPHCGKSMTASTGSEYHDDEPRPPIDGDYCLCVYCGVASVFSNGPLGLHVRKMNQQEALDYNLNHGEHHVEVLARYRALGLHTRWS